MGNGLISKKAHENIAYTYRMGSYNGQAQQDKFTLTVLKEKKNDYFLEIGSNHPININNTYILEKEYDWRGIMVEYRDQWLSDYKKHRPNSIHVIKDATQIDYKRLFKDNNVPLNIGYLQIDLEVNNGSTLKTLNKLDNDVFDEYKFATVTFEHDVYRGDTNTREKSREIFKKRGYVCVFEDINNEGHPYEDWYVHPDLVDMNYIGTLKKENQKRYKPNSSVRKRTRDNQPVLSRSIDWKDIVY